MLAHQNHCRLGCDFTQALTFSINDEPASLDVFIRGVVIRILLHYSACPSSSLACSAASFSAFSSGFLSSSASDALVGFFAVEAAAAFFLVALLALGASGALNSPSSIIAISAPSPSRRPILIILV